MNNQESYSYKFSSREQEEIKKIREKYIDSELKLQEDKSERIKKLDRKVSTSCVVFSLTLGVIGLLVMGTGMSLVLVWNSTLMFEGIIIGLIGIAMIAAAYPLYNFILKIKRKKIAPEIIKLCDEIIEQ